MNIKPIETLYKGYRFRSRLEARWAVFFDVLGLKWEYEPEGFETSAGWYLPDFRVVPSAPIYMSGVPNNVMWVEIKPGYCWLPSARDPRHLSFQNALPRGQVFVVYDRDPYAHLELTAGGITHDEDRWRAATVARAARFEHGETPRV